VSSFLHRHIGPDAIQQTRMLDRLGLSSLDELVDKAMPAASASTTG
jgi:glycine dehydrogenase